MITLINRLGFDAWASNIAVNIIENGDLRDGYKCECDDYSVVISKFENRHLVTVRAYVANAGWETAEIVF